MQYLMIDSHDPAFNLALEEHLLLSLPDGHPGYFLLWQNEPSIIIGRHQCAQEEINTPFIYQTHLPVIRRITGGGAVYHDAGNLNFSFICHCHEKYKWNLKPYLERICGVLARLGVQAAISGRNDLEVDGHKISGNAQIMLNNRVLHHGALLVNVDLDTLAVALKPGADKIKSKGIASVRARVANISQFWNPNANMELLKNYLADACSTGPAIISDEQEKAAQKLANEKYRLDKWNFGATPPYDLEKRRRFACGEIILKISVRHNKIGSCHIFGDFFSSMPMSALENALAGVELSPPSLAAALKDFDFTQYFNDCRDAEIREFFIGLSHTAYN